MEATTIAKNIGHSLTTWEWTRKLLHWLIISAGTMSECAFLIASLWMSINASVHTFVLLFMDEQATIHITQLATTAYVALPELILGLAFVVTIGHIRLWWYDRQNYSALAWSILYGLPTVIFLLLSLYTLGSSVASATFTLPEPLIVIRALAGFHFAFISLLYAQLGVPQERDRLQQKDDFLAQVRREKDATIADLQQKHEQNLVAVRLENEIFITRLRREKDAIIAGLQGDVARLTDFVEQQKAELEKQNGLLAESKTTQAELIKTIYKSSEDALQGYSEECKRWLNCGIKTTLTETIMRYTGHSKRKIENAISKGTLQLSPRNRDLILMSSLIKWLEATPAPVMATEQEPPRLHVV